MGFTCGLFSNFILLTSIVIMKILQMLDTSKIFYSGIWAVLNVFAKEW